MATAERGLDLAHTTILSWARGDVELLSSGKAPVDLGPDGDLVQCFVLSLTWERRISNALFEDVTARFDTKPAFDTISLAGMYMTVSALVNAFEVPAG